MDKADETLTTGASGVNDSEQYDFSAFETIHLSRVPTIEPEPEEPVVSKPQQIADVSPGKSAGLPKWVVITVLILVVIALSAVILVVYNFVPISVPNQP